MLIAIPDLLLPHQVLAFRESLDKAEWVDGRETAGTQSREVKSNLQLTENSPLAKALGEVIFEALAQNALFVSAALPLKIFPPLFNQYGEGGHFGIHVDNAIRAIRQSTVRVRTDLAATLFLSEPESYDGGELIIEDQYGAQQVKLPAGHMILYPANSLHQVNPVARGKRISSFFWVQSMVRDNARRALLFDLDQSIQEFARIHGLGHDNVVRLSGVYQNLIRQWADT